jgi:hypothetical protein
MGMSFELEGLYFNPVVPEVYGGQKSLSGFKYRKAVLEITVKGFGNKIREISLDGQPLENGFVPHDLAGTHTVHIELANNEFEQTAINLVANHFSLPNPQTEKDGDMLTWNAVKGAQSYRVYQNGAFLESTTQTQFKVPPASYATYKVSAIDDQGYESFTSEPLVFARSVQIVEMENFASASKLPYTNYSGKGFVEISHSVNPVIEGKIRLEKAGEYLLDIRYANGSGPWNTDNKCGIRSLSVNDVYQGVWVFPQRGLNEWSDWGFSNSRKVQLKAGENSVKISFEAWNENMNGEINRAMLDYLRVTAIE